MSLPPCPPNKAGIQNLQELQQAEARLSAIGIVQILSGEHRLPAPHGERRLCEIHKALFGDLYEWGGQVRTTPLSKQLFDGMAGRTHFVPPPAIASELRGLFAGVSEANSYKGLGRLAFVDAATDFIGHLNRIHPFIEGNGRTQRLYTTLLARDAGHALDFRAVTSERMIAASIEHAQGKPGMLRDLIDEQTDPTRMAILQGAHDHLSRHLPELNDRFLATTAPGNSYHGVVAMSGSETFIFAGADNRSIYVGNNHDVGGKPKPGAQVAFVASRSPEHAAQHWFDLAEVNAKPGKTREAIAAALRSMPPFEPGRDVIRALAPQRIEQAQKRDSRAMTIAR